MGQTLSEPVTEKNSGQGHDDRVTFGYSAMQGWRISMEDAHAAVLDLQVTDEKDKDYKKAALVDRVSFFGVYDGHGGDRVALFAGENVHNIIAQQEAFKKKDFKQALKDGFLVTDRAILSDPRYEEEVSGCTACVAIITDKEIFCGNAGDSRAVLGIKGRAKPLSYDHKPQNELEKARITNAGGFVDFGRVNGNLALSRALGDFEFKKSAELPPEDQVVTANPDVEAHTIGEDDEFLVIACDGIWDVQSSQAVIEFVRRGVAAKQELHKICENMMDNCLSNNTDGAGVGCDNMTMIIIALLRGETTEQWYEKVAKRVADGDGPCAPPEAAEQRGPGSRSNFENSDDDFDLDLDQRTQGLSGNSGRIILLGDGTEVLTDSDEHENYGEDEDDDELRNQASPRSQETLGNTAADFRHQREDTPAPEPVEEQHGSAITSESPLSTTPTSSTPISSTTNAVANDAIPEKLTTPTPSQ